MSWSRLNNPKPPAAGALKPTMIRVVSSQAARQSRYLRIKIGADLARRGSFTRGEHKCHLLAGSGDEAGQLAVVVDDSGGAFVARRKADGRYEIAVTARAAAGLFSVQFNQFDREGGVVPMNGSPAFITFDAKPIMLNGSAK